MKGVKTEITINSVRSRKDKSIGFSAETPELTNEERNVFFDLQGKVSTMLLVPQENENAPVYEVDKSIGQKTPSQRLYSVIYVLYQQSGSNEEFRPFYDRIMEKIIDQIKERLI